jgi:predicted MFS family arabinose efflux permease
VWAGISAGGGAIGLLLGGVLTELLSWEWIFFVNVPIGIVAFVASVRFVPESRLGARAGNFDLPGALLATSGLVLLTYAIVKAESWGFGDARTVGVGGTALALLAAFFVLESRIKAPLVRLDLFRVRSLAASNSAMLLVGGGLFAFFFFGTLYLQQVKGFTPIETGFAFLRWPSASASARASPSSSSGGSASSRSCSAGSSPRRSGWCG